jgi:hypothetical protein
VADNGRRDKKWMKLLWAAALADDGDWITTRNIRLIVAQRVFGGRLTIYLNPFRVEQLSRVGDASSS